MRILESFVSDRLPSKSGNQSKLVKSSRACRVISYTVSFMLFNFQGTRPVRCSQRRIFILAHLFGFVKGFFFPSPEGVTLSKSAPQALLPALWMGGCLAVPLGSSSTSLPHPPAFVKTFFLPADFFFDRAAGVLLSGCQAVWKQLCYNIIIFL